MKKHLIISGIVILSLVLSHFLIFKLAVNASTSCLATNIHDKNGRYFVIPCWVITKSKAFQEAFPSN